MSATRARGWLWMETPVGPLLVGLASLLIGVGLVGSSLGSVMVADALAPAASGVTGPDETQSARLPDPRPGEVNEAQVRRWRSTIVHNQSARAHSRSDAAQTPIPRPPASAMSALSLQTQPFDARDWLFMAGMASRRHSPGNPDG